MMVEKNLLEKQPGSETGAVKIADDVVAVIAGMAATEVEGVAGMSGGIGGGIAEMLGRKNLAKGVKVTVGETEAAIELYVIVQFGARIPDVALKIQDNVKKAVESMTGLRAVEINVHVQGVALPVPEANDEELRLK